MQDRFEKDGTVEYETIGETLVSAGYFLSLRGFSALDRYLDHRPLPFVWVETDADIPALARLFEGLRFPGVNLADGAIEAGEGSWFFHCIDRDEGPSEAGHPSYELLSLTQDWPSGRFRDPCGLYPLIRKLRDGPACFHPAAGGTPKPEEPWWTGIYPQTGRYRALMDGALILARYESSSRPAIGGLLQNLADLPRDQGPGTEGQRVLLTSLLMSPHPELGLELLKAAGFVEEFWPELALLDDVDHSKEYHPEGNVWNHTLETFRYRKAASRKQPEGDLRLSLGLLLHDAGKPLAASSGSRRFDGHAELGARVARRFLDRLQFDPSLIDDICYLVRNHMLPAALPRLPLARTREILESPLFPTLMELYRCDESSSFKVLDGYYASSAAYRAYLKHRRNPYRNDESGLKRSRP
ncbi:MAG: HD domain-containing protein [Spirochaetaceae bacterium]|jgi:poly(A) polymerase|nr:HD domain-containing protein [Spirochaetaceae bacterium]